jgi:hypothetical protein
MEQQMSRKQLSVKSNREHKYFVFDSSDGRLDNFSYGFLGGSFSGKAGSASSLSDAIELSKALTSGSNHEVEISDYD